MTFLYLCVDTKTLAWPNTEPLSQEKKKNEQNSNLIKCLLTVSGFVTSFYCFTKVEMCYFKQIFLVLFFFVFEKPRH